MPHYYDVVIPLIRGRRVLDAGSIGHTYAGRDGYKVWNFGVLAKHAAEIRGFDILEEDVKAARSDGFDIEVGDAETYLSNQRHEVVFAGDLIEHLSNPGKFLDCSFKNLEPGGLLVLATPNTFSFAKLARALGRWTNEPPVNPEHTFYFTPKTLTQLVTRHGFHLEKMDYCDFEYTTQHGGLFKRLQLYTNSAFSKWFPKFSQVMIAVYRKAA